MEETKKLIKNVFCAKEQIVTPHAGAVDGNGEFVFTCETPECGRFIKLPADTDLLAFNTYSEAHKIVNAGQIDIGDQQKKLEKLFAEE